MGLVHGWIGWRLHCVEGVLLLIEIGFPVAEISDALYKFLAFSDKLFLRAAFKILTDIISKILQKFDVLEILIVLALNCIFSFFVFIINSFDQPYKIFFNEIFLRADLDMKFL